MKYLKQYKQFTVGDQVIVRRKSFTIDKYPNPYVSPYVDAYIGYIDSISGPHINKNINKYYYNLNIIANDIFRSIQMYALNRYNHYDINIIK